VLTFSEIKIIKIQAAVINRLENDLIKTGPGRQQRR
jgi:hypothetical protein